MVSPQNQLPLGSLENKRKKRGDRMKLFKCEDGSLFDPNLVIKVEPISYSYGDWLVVLKGNGENTDLRISATDYERLMKLLNDDGLKGTPW